MYNKYIMAEEQDFEKISYVKYIKHLYIGNNEGIEYIDISNYVLKHKINSLKSMFELINNKDKKYNVKGIKLINNSINYMDFAFDKIKLESLDLSELNVENVTNFYETFQEFESQSLNLSNFNTKNSLNFDKMFTYAKIKKLDISSFYFNNNASINYIFEGLKCEELILPESFPIILKHRVFHNCKIKVIKTSNKIFYKKYKEWFKNKHNAELILIP